jgi:hypothetical protein
MPASATLPRPAWFADRILGASHRGIPDLKRSGRDSSDEETTEIRSSYHVRIVADKRTGAEWRIVVPTERLFFASTGLGTRRNEFDMKGVILEAARSTVIFDLADPLCSIDRSLSNGEYHG